MSILKRLFGRGGGSGAREVEPEIYKDFRIWAAPAREGGRWRVGAKIESIDEGEDRVHNLIRADLLDDEESAVRVSLAKARQVIDEQGARIFD